MPPPHPWLSPAVSLEAEAVRALADRLALDMSTNLPEDDWGTDHARVIALPHLTDAYRAGHDEACRKVEDFARALLSATKARREGEGVRR
jgi:hypothetical protein